MFYFRAQPTRYKFIVIDLDDIPIILLLIVSLVSSTSYISFCSVYCILIRLVLLRFFCLSNVYLLMFVNDLYLLYVYIFL